MVGFSVCLSQLWDRSLHRFASSLLKEIRSEYDHLWIMAVARCDYDDFDGS